MMSGATLIKPPPVDGSMSNIENLLDLTQLTPIDPNLYTNTRPLWHPPGARGIFGGAAIAQCLAAAQKTVPPDFYIHSMHCYFILAGNSNIPIIYHVERVRDGKSFCTRTVQARQNAKPIFTTTMSFTREGSGGTNVVSHDQQLPAEIRAMGAPDESNEGDDSSGGAQSPFASLRLGIMNKDSTNPSEKKVYQWIKARGTISPSGRHEAHLSALAYMSDSYFIGTIARVHNLWRFVPGRERKQPPSIDEETLQKLLAEDEATIEKVKQSGVGPKDIERLKKPKEKRPEVGMMVSLDHTIYFHRPRDFRADEWILAEMESPWAGDGRGLVFQKLFTKDGKLIATCVQEGVVRLRTESESKL